MNNMRGVRLSRSMAQQELAVKAGMNPSSLTAIEKYNYCPTPKTRKKIAEVLGVAEQELWPKPTERTNVR